MDVNDRCTNLGEKILPIVLPSMVEAEKFSDHPCTCCSALGNKHKALGYRS